MFHPASTPSRCSRERWAFAELHTTTKSYNRVWSLYVMFKLIEARQHDSSNYSAVVFVPASLASSLAVTKGLPPRSVSMSFASDLLSGVSGIRIVPDVY